MRIWNDTILALTALSLASCVCAPVTDQGGVVQLPCCQAAQDQPLNISTGVAPWRVRTPGSADFERALPLFILGSGWVPAPLGDPVATPPPPAESWYRFTPARWIGPRSESPPPGDHFYEVQFFVPPCLNMRTVTIEGRFAAANSAAVSVPGGPEFRTTSGPRQADIRRFDANYEGLAEGTYTLRVRVTSEGQPTGLIVQATATTRCG